MTGKDDAYASFRNDRMRLLALLSRDVRCIIVTSLVMLATSTVDLHDPNPAHAHPVTNDARACPIKTGASMKVRGETSGSCLGFNVQDR